MTKYARRRAVVVGEAGGIGLAIAKRLVEGGASVLLAARTAETRALAVTELGSAARVVAPSAVAEVLAGGTAPRTGTGGHDRPGLRADLLFADAIPTARPLLPYVEDGGAIVLTS
ncbi:SDR family NAD(P)-dependent oxidoreductase, partial [Streptomyces rubiginosohelvolus]